METLTIAYKILKGLEKKKDRPTSEVISPAAVKADPQKWREVVESLLDEGYGINDTPFSEHRSGVDLFIERWLD